ncbi:hypothetical protein NMR92_001374 [Vibrio cholerae]|uniref:Uncharacterized protein n=1 Tax=Vibrio parahaemolyticus TaxID=670 RepID=A0A1B1LRF5_VIBPH|nr:MULTISPECIES: hypothetical protein [Vibrio]EJL6490474.1 hypothetical protein [Vibrio cholerae]ANS55609.1 hypothetical protein [Vibrio parahaemolyticus]EJL6642165.1 hypothetical protein [Vibrio cholerae]MCI9701179.1 hypothetical protein [Vibrio parahaemolyticus]MCR9814161.1 hypothetical protein [Vibrio parahaemolyticus]
MKYFAYLVLQMGVFAFLLHPVKASYVVELVIAAMNLLAIISLYRIVTPKIRPMVQHKLAVVVQQPVKTTIDLLRYDSYESMVVFFLAVGPALLSFMAYVQFFK